jgi:large subunit ribosomal protein L22
MITAKLRYLRISPRKVRLVTDLIKGLSVIEAERQLKFLTKKTTKPVLKLLNSAVANAKNKANLVKENLYVSNITIESGPTLKRWRPRAMGRAAPIMKRTSHITLILDEREASVSPKVKEVEPKIAKPEKPLVEKEEKKELELLEEIQRIKEEKGPVPKPKPVPPPRPYPTTSQSKKKFFSRQTFGNIKKYFRRKSI